MWRNERERRRPIYGIQDGFATRDRYRHTVERIAKRSLLTEEDVANKAAIWPESAMARLTIARMLAYLIDKSLLSEREADLSLS